MNMETRWQIIRMLDDRKIRVLVSVNTLAEGIDICSADTAILVEPRNSQLISVRYWVGC